VSLNLVIQTPQPLKLTVQPPQEIKSVIKELINLFLIIPN